MKNRCIAIVGYLWRESPRTEIGVPNSLLLRTFVVIALFFSPNLTFLLSRADASAPGVRSCQQLFDSSVASASEQVPTEFAIRVSDPSLLAESAGLQVRRYQGDQFPVLDLRWPRPPEQESAPAIFRFPKTKFTTNPSMIGPHRMSEVGPFVGPRFFVRTPHPQARFRIQLTIEGEVYEASLSVRRSPTFVGLRAVDFVSTSDSSRKLQSWIPEITELRILLDNPRDRELSIVGDLNITFNPRWSDLFSAEVGRQKLLHFLLKGQRATVPAAEQRDIDHFVRRYIRIPENADFARVLGGGGRRAIEEFLEPFGFESKELRLGGQLGMENFLAQWNLDPTGRVINIPSEPNLFGQAHGEFSHALQVVAMLKGASRAEAEAIHRVIKSIVSVDRTDMWFCISGLLTSFAGDGPNSTAWWPVEGKYDTTE